MACRQVWRLLWAQAELEDIAQERLRQLALPEVQWLLLNRIGLSMGIRVK